MRQKDDGKCSDDQDFDRKRVQMNSHIQHEGNYPETTVLTSKESEAD